MAVKTQKDSLAIGSVQSGCRVSEVSHRLNRWLSKFNQGKHSALEMGGSKLARAAASSLMKPLFSCFLVLHLTMTFPLDFFISKTQVSLSK